MKGEVEMGWEGRVWGDGTPHKCSCLTVGCSRDHLWWLNLQRGKVWVLLRWVRVSWHSGDCSGLPCSVLKLE